MSREVSSLFFFFFFFFEFILIDHVQSPKPSAPSPPAAQTDEEKRIERLAKLEAWKQKLEAKREGKQRGDEPAGGSRNILDEIDRKSGVAAKAAPPTSTSSGKSTPFGLYFYYCGFTDRLSLKRHQ